MAKKTICAHQPKVKATGAASVKVDAEAKVFAKKESKVEVKAQYANVSKTSTATVAVKSTLPRPTPKMRREIFARHQGCQFKDLETGKLCGSKFFLEVDHIRPRFAGGSNEPENLRALCKNHNLFRYREGI